MKETNLPIVSWAASQEGWTAAKRGDSAPLLCPCETPIGALHPALGPLASGGHGSAGVGREKSHEEDQKAGAPLL